MFGSELHLAAGPPPKPFFKGNWKVLVPPPPPLNRALKTQFGNTF